MKVNSTYLLCKHPAIHKRGLFLRIYVIILFYRTMRLLKTIFIVSIILTGCISAPMNAVESPFPAAGTDTAPQPGSDTLTTTAETSVEPYVEYNSGASGKAPAGTVISVNEMIALVSTDEMFSFPILLEEGPNVIEFVASDVDGNEIAFVLTVIYEP